MYQFTSEVVSGGHPDKCADVIADGIVDYVLAIDKNSRVASEVFVAGKNIIIGGEIKTQANMGDNGEVYHQIVRDTLTNIGYGTDNYFSYEEALHTDDIHVQVLINQQSPDISQGVDQSSGEIGAGDQGIMFGYANSETDNYMPSALTYARTIMEKVYQYALANPHQLGVDIKTQVTVDYGSKENFINCLPQKIETIVVSAPSVGSMEIDEVRQLIKSIIDSAGLDERLYDPDNCTIHINPTGKYTNHSSLHDAGLTGRKLIVDSFGGYAPIGGGAQSSKDYTKVDRSGLYAARWLAKHIVAAGLAKRATVQLSYAIGIAKPLSVSVNTEGTDIVEGVDDGVLSDFLIAHYPLTPQWITEKFGLDRPSKETFLYADVAARGQVGQEDYPWEELDELTRFIALKGANNV